MTHCRRKMHLLMRLTVTFLQLCLIFPNASKGITCLSCTGIVEPRFCEFVRRCPDHNFCGVKKYTTENNEQLFDVDCVSDGMCYNNLAGALNVTWVTNAKYQFLHRQDVCGECCSKDVCNHKGCGQLGYPVQRGPVCYNCKQELDPAKCGHVTICRTDEMCNVVRHELFGEYFYESRCVPKYECGTAVSGLFGRRKRQGTSSTPCTSCCNTDLCNNHCGENFQPITLSTTIAAVSVATTISPSASPSDTSAGHEFVFMFMNPKSEQNNNSTYGNIAVISSAGQVAITIPVNSSDVNNATFTKLSQGVVKFNVTVNSLMNYSAIEHKAIQVQTAVPATVFAMYNEIGSSDGFLVLPTAMCSTNYVVPSYPPYNYRTDFNTSIGIVSLNDDTLVYVTLKMSSYFYYNNIKHDSGDEVILNLQKHETFQISSLGDLTGTLITSSKPVCVTSGTQCANIYYSSSRCPRMEEMIPPVDYFSFKFIVPVLQGKRSSEVRVLAYTDKTHMSADMDGTFVDRTFDKGSFETVSQTSKSPVVISTNHPVIVTQYPYGPSGRYEDSFMMNIPGVNQYKPHYDFYVQGDDYVTYVSVIIKSAYSQGLLLDGHHFTIINESRHVCRLDSIAYDVFNVNVFPGVHTMTHTSQEKFGLFVYGHKYLEGQHTDAYGYAAGFTAR